MIGGLASVVTSQTFDLVVLAVTIVRRVASEMGLRVATLFLAQAFDLATFSVMVARHGATAEANPVVSDLFDSYGMPAVVVVKLPRPGPRRRLACRCAVAPSRRGVWSVIGGLPLALAIAAGLIGGIGIQRARGDLTRLSTGRPPVADAARARLGLRLKRLFHSTG